MEIRKRKKFSSITLNQPVDGLRIKQPFSQTPKLVITKKTIEPLRTAAPILNTDCLSRS